MSEARYRVSDFAQEKEVDEKWIRDPRRESTHPYQRAKISRIVTTPQTYRHFHEKSVSTSSVKTPLE
jgi:hypothetical protein